MFRQQNHSQFFVPVPFSDPMLSDQQAEEDDFDTFLATFAPSSALESSQASEHGSCSPQDVGNYSLDELKVMSPEPHQTTHSAADLPQQALDHPSPDQDDLTDGHDLAQGSGFAPVSVNPPEPSPEPSQPTGQRPCWKTYFSNKTEFNRFRPQDMRPEFHRLLEARQVPQMDRDLLVEELEREAHHHRRVNNKRKRSERQRKKEVVEKEKKWLRILQEYVQEMRKWPATVPPEHAGVLGTLPPLPDVAFL